MSDNHISGPTLLALGLASYALTAWYSYGAHSAVHHALAGIALRAETAVILAGLVGSFGWRRVGYVAFLVACAAAGLVLLTDQTFHTVALEVLSWIQP